MVARRQGEIADHITVRMRRALTEEAQRIRQLENEDVATFRALQRLEEILNEIPSKGGSVRSEERALAIESIQRIQRLLDMRCAELANIWEPRVESLILDMAELRLLTSEQDPQAP